MRKPRNAGAGCGRRPRRRWCAAASSSQEARCKAGRFQKRASALPGDQCFFESYPLGNHPAHAAAFHANQSGLEVQCIFFFCPLLFSTPSKRRKKERKRKKKRRTQRNVASAHANADKVSLEVLIKARVPLGAGPESELCIADSLAGFFFCLSLVRSFFGSTFRRETRHFRISKLPGFSSFRTAFNAF